MPNTYSGGGAPIGNRYYLSYYPLFLFLLPVLRDIRPAIAALAVGALFTAKLTLNPFYTSSNPGEHAKAGPLRLLPIELTLLNDLAVSADPERSRRGLGGTPPVAGYFVDDGAYPPEGGAFWVRGDSRADVVLRAPTVLTPSGEPTPLRVRAWSFEVTNGSVSNRKIPGPSAVRPEVPVSEKAWVPESEMAWAAPENLPPSGDRCSSARPFANRSSLRKIEILQARRQASRAHPPAYPTKTTDWNFASVKQASRSLIVRRQAEQPVGSAFHRRRTMQRASRN